MRLNNTSRLHQNMITFIKVNLQLFPAFKEGLKVPPPAMQRIIEGANSDIRQILNHLAVWTAGSKTISYEQV